MFTYNKVRKQFHEIIYTFQLPNTLLTQLFNINSYQLDEWVTDFRKVPKTSYTTIKALHSVLEHCFTAVQVLDAPNAFSKTYISHWLYQPIDTRNGLTAYPYMVLLNVDFNTSVQMLTQLIIRQANKMETVSVVAKLLPEWNTNLSPVKEFS